MPKSYADLLREARGQIPEVTPQEVATLPAGAATIVDVREASEWEQGHLPGAAHVSKSYIEQQIEAVAPGPRRPGDPVLRRRRSVAVRGPDARRDGLHGRQVDEQRLPGLEERGPRVRHARSC